MTYTLQSRKLWLKGDIREAWVVYNFLIIYNGDVVWYINSSLIKTHLVSKVTYIGWQAGITNDRVIAPFWRIVCHVGN